jgi:hypothetical protein
LPEAVVVDEEGYLSVAYAELIPVLIAAFKQHLESYQNDKEEFKKEFEAIRGELKDKSNCLSTKDELNRLTRQMNSLITTVNNHKVCRVLCVCVVCVVCVCVFWMDR